MNTKYNPSLKAHLTTDANKKVKHIRHSQEYFFSEENIPRLSAAEYLKQVADVYQIPQEQLQNLHKKVSFLNPIQQGIEYQQLEEKQFFDSSIIGYYQTYLNVPVWRKGLSVKIKQNPYRIVGSTNNSEEKLNGKLPKKEVIERYKKIFSLFTNSKTALLTSRQEEDASAFMRGTIGLSAKTRGKRASKDNNTGAIKPLNGRFFIYKYDSRKRYAGKPTPTDDKTRGTHSLETHAHPFVKIPPVSERIKNGQAYLVAEITFKQTTAQYGEMMWLILVELETGSILYIEPMTHGVNGLVFKRDPNVSTGDLTINSSQSNTDLDDHDTDVLLTDLDAPSGGIQSLSGTYVVIQNEENPNITPPTEATGTDFDYNPRTNDFAAVNAYYHQTELFKTIESLGFPVATYFDGTTFPIPVDHRGMGTLSAETINAHWSPNGSGDGTDHMCYALCDTTDLVNPLGRAVDPWVHWHEMGGHGTLGDHVGTGLLGFSHSAGDGLAALQMDPESALRTVPERFRYAPFRPFTSERRFDRDVTTWAWESGNDDGSYGSEQILATCHFRIYRSIGGDHDNLGRRQFASRATTYLILRTTSNLTPATNPNDAEVWCEEMQATDLENWTSEGISGGAYNKVIRWAFEKQGSYSGNAPDVDVYINDGRNGEYEFQSAHWNNTSMWNRNSADGLTGHQDAIPDETNYMYVKVKNRGTNSASDVTIKGYHCLPGAGLTWPVDFTEMTPAGGLDVASIGANDSEEITVGPFEWIPNENIYGHDCVLMIASAPGDPSNIDNFTVGETIEEWRLVPNDNNIGQRNVTILPGGGGEDGLMKGLHKHIFYAGNSFRIKAKMELKVDLPRVLIAAGWKLKFEGIDDNKFELKPGAKRKIVIDLIPGNNFTADQVRNTVDRDIMVTLYANNVLLGGMTYRLDPDKKEPGYIPGVKGKCKDKAQDLLKCLNLGDGKVKNVCVKKVSLDIELNNDCKCD